MCIAILNTKGTTLKKQILSNCWENNGDGAGILYINDENKMEAFKTLDSFDDFYSNYIDIKQTYGKRKNMLLHFRISTHGTINEENCHPFIVDENVGFIHNGMISEVPDSNQYSDTNMLNRTLLQKLSPGFEQDDDVLEFLASMIGIGNKLVFLNSDNEWSIVNEEVGHWNLGCWFSNDSYKQVNNWYDFGGVRKQKKGQVGFTPAYSARDFYNDAWDDGGYGTALDTTYDDSDDLECQDCGVKLYGIHEMGRGTCDHCEEIRDAEKETTPTVAQCDVCNWHDGEYREDWQAHVCEECLAELNGEELGA